MSKSIYFASDFHLGAPNWEESLKREKLLVSWLDEIKPNTAELFLVGDIFDFWFEYKNAVPKGFVRLIGKLAEFSDDGIPIHIFTGNHDMWMYDYLTVEVGAQIYKEPVEIRRHNKDIYIGHGDGLGPGDHSYKFLKRIFSNKLCQWMFARLHPNFGIGLANYFSKSSRAKTGSSDEVFLGEEKEWLVIYSKEILDNRHFDYFIFGHRHLPLDINLSDNSTYVNLGDWIKYFSYGKLTDGHLELLYYKS